MLFYLALGPLVPTPYQANEWFSFLGRKGPVRGRLRGLPPPAEEVLRRGRQVLGLRKPGQKRLLNNVYDFLALLISSPKVGVLGCSKDWVTCIPNVILN